MKQRIICEVASISDIGKYARFNLTDGRERYGKYDYFASIAYDVIGKENITFPIKVRLDGLGFEYFHVEAIWYNGSWIRRLSTRQKSKLNTYKGCKEKEMEIILRRQAISEGLDRYFTGKPCKQGHVAERVTKNANCVLCTHKRIEPKSRIVYNKKLIRGTKVVQGVIELISDDKVCVKKNDGTLEIFNLKDIKCPVIY